jgi:Ca-activated chloride channel family protein
MKPKLAAVEDAIKDLMLSLDAREGKSELSVFHFPGTGALVSDAELDVDWTDQLAKVNNLFYKLSMRGATPTGPAIMKAVRHYGQSSSPRHTDHPQEHRVTPGRDESEGMLRDYVI